MMIVNQKVKLRGTNYYGYISVPIEVEIIWEDNKQKGTVILDELEFIGKKLLHFAIKEKEVKSDGS